MAVSFLLKLLNKVYDMKRVILFCLLMVMLLMTACSSPVQLSTEETALVGEWAYNHEPTEAVLILKDDGTAKFKGNEYTFNCEDGFINLTADSEDLSLKLRYQEKKDGILLYEQERYQRDSGTEGLVGIWTVPEKHMEFEFTDEGTFMEDGYFPGYYFLSEDGKSFKLAYNDMFEDTTCYFEIEADGRLFLEYPWKLVRKQ